MHTVFALLCFVVVIHWLNFPYPSGVLHWHCGNLTIAPVPAKQPWWIWINTSCEFVMNDCITTTKQSTTKPCAYFLGYTVRRHLLWRLQRRRILPCTWALQGMPPPACNDGKSRISTHKFVDNHPIFTVKFSHQSSFFFGILLCTLNTNCKCSYRSLWSYYDS